jgi:hypothetical protein
VIAKRAAEILATVENNVTQLQPAPQPPATPPAPGQINAAIREILQSASSSITARPGSRATGAADREARIIALVKAVQSAVKDAGPVPILAAIVAATSDQAILETLRRIAENPGPPDEAVSRAASQLQEETGARRPVDRKLLLAATALVVACGSGVGIPLVVGAGTAEIIFTNEVAIASIVVAIAALRKG